MKARWLVFVFLALCGPLFAAGERRQTTLATGGTTISETLAPGFEWQIEEVRLHLSAAGGAGSFTVTEDSGSTTTTIYNTVFATQDMSSATDYIWRPTRPVTFSASDEVDFGYANANTKTWGLEVVWRAHRYD
jgi:hypothetical protein